MVAGLLKLLPFFTLVLPGMAARTLFTNEVLYKIYCVANFWREILKNGNFRWLVLVQRLANPFVVLKLDALMWHLYFWF